MARRDQELDWRTTNLERQMAGMQRQVSTLHALVAAKNKATDKRLRDLEIKVADSQGVPRKDIAKIHHISPSSVTRICKAA